MQKDLVKLFARVCRASALGSDGPGGCSPHPGPPRGWHRSRCCRSGSDSLQRRLGMLLGQKRPQTYCAPSRLLQPRGTCRRSRPSRRARPGAPHRSRLPSRGLGRIPARRSSSAPRRRGAASLPGARRPPRLSRPRLRLRLRRGEAGPGSRCGGGAAAAVAGRRRRRAAVPGGGRFPPVPVSVSEQGPVPAPGSACRCSRSGAGPGAPEGLFVPVQRSLW